MGKISVICFSANATQGGMFIEILQFISLLPNLQTEKGQPELLRLPG